MRELAKDPEIGAPEVRSLPEPGSSFNRVGIGSVEAPRGTLTHHYTTDERGVLKHVNLIVGTTNNYAPIAMSIKRVAEKLITGGKVVEEGILNRVEMAFRLYDPCFSCATHALPGKMPMELKIRDRHGELLRTIKRD
jgi:F420-non-reducing hydrogenase large subunit